MRPYEVMVIYDPSLEDDAIRAAVDRSTELVRSRGGNPGRVDRWGKRRLAYEIRHQREGYYVLVEATAEPAVMAELDRSLTLADEVLRHKVIRLPDSIAARPSRPASRPGPETAPPANVVAHGATESSPRPNGA
jgi:small subunit ribosomal protein S6